MRLSLSALLFASISFFFAPSEPRAAQKAEPKKADPVKVALAEARSRSLHGNYDEARKAYEAAAKKDAKLASYASLGIAETYRLAGDYDKAAAILDDAKKASPENPDILAARADLLYDLGRWDDAEKDADDAIKKKDAQLSARYTKARILRDRGKIDDADKAFRWVVRHYTARSNADDDITDPDELIMVAQCGAENARWHNLSKQFSFILNEVIKDINKGDKEYFPAELLAGQLLLEKYNRPDAIDAFDKALEINPKAAEALVGKAKAALVKFDLKDADSLIDQALSKNGNLPSALALKADLLLLANDTDGALKLLKKAKGINPRDSRVLGKLAAVYHLLGDKPAFEAIVKEVEVFDSAPGLFYFELGSCLDDRKRYIETETYYKKAAELRPLLAGPRTNLGMLYLRLGKEEEGRKLLDAAFKADPFNVRVANSRKVLTHLDGYTTVITDHYIVRFDSKTDKVLGEWASEYLEDTHAELKKQYGFEPQGGKILIEIFNTHEMFSGRTVGLPDLHTVGACIGRVVAIASPKAKGLVKPFNWGRVIRHELTHIFNLAQTNYLCPHWLTEGLAVRNEKMNKPPQWLQILRDRQAAGTLFNLDNVMMGFVRPKNQDEWTLAYFQSNLYVEYMVKAHGEPAVVKLLEAYRTGLDNAAAIRAACGENKAEFEKGYKKYVESVLAASPGGAKKANPEKALTFEELKDAVAANPDDDDLKARLADQLYRRNKMADAKKIVDELWEKNPGHPGTALVRAKILMKDEDTDAAKVTLEAALKKAPEDPRVLAALGKVLVVKKEYDEAAVLFEKGRKLAPLDSDWAEQLIKIYKQTKDSEKIIPFLQEIVGYDPDDIDARLQLAKIRQESGDFAAAEALALDALLIDVTNADAKAALLAAYKSQKKDAEAAKLEKRYEK